LKHPSPRLFRSGVLALTLAFGLGDAPAQELAPPPSRQRGAFLVPMLTVSETFDDNLLFTQFPEGDFVTRATASVEMGYRSTAFTFYTAASRAGDTFSLHPEFNTTDARTFGHVALAYMPSRSLTLATTAIYLKTLTPSELNTLTGLSVGRSLAERAAVIPTMEMRLGQFSTAIGFFTLSDDTLDGRFAGTRTGGLAIDRRLSGRHTVSVRYERRWFSFSRKDSFRDREKSTADVLTVGWMTDLDAHTVLSLRAGPRSAKGRVNPEVLASVKRRLKHGRVSLTYTRNQATTLGKVGALDTQALVALYTVRVARELEISSGPGVYRNALRGFSLSACRLNVEALWHFSHFFYLGAGYALDMQQPDFGADGLIRRGALGARLIVSPPQRRLESPTDVVPDGTDSQESH